MIKTNVRETVTHIIREDVYKKIAEEAKPVNIIKRIDKNIKDL